METGLGNEFWAAIVGAVVGAVAGGAIAYLLQRLSLGEARKLREAAQLATNKALGHALLLKMVQIFSNLVHFHAHMEESWRAEIAQDPAAEPWQVVKPIINLPDWVRFTVEEKSLLLSFKDDDLFNSMVSMDAIHNDLVNLFAAYEEKRTALVSLLPSQMEGAVGTVEISREQWPVIRPRMIEVNLLGNDIRARSKQDYEQARHCFDRLQEVLKSNLGFTYKLEKKDNFPSEEEAVAVPSS